MVMVFSSRCWVEEISNPPSPAANGVARWRALLSVAVRPKRGGGERVPRGAENLTSERDGCRGADENGDGAGDRIEGVSNQHPTPFARERRWNLFHRVLTLHM